MSWNEINKRLRELSPEQMTKLFKGLHNLSAQNKAWLGAKLLQKSQDTAYLEDYRNKIIRYVYKGTKGIPPMPCFGEAKKVIAEYRKFTGDMRGALDLMLTYIERGHQFTLDFGDINESFYMALENMWENLTDELHRSPAKYELYEQFEPRLMKMRRKSDIGWGYGDTVRETVDELKNLLER